MNSVDVYIYLFLILSHWLRYRSILWFFIREFVSAVLAVKLAAKKVAGFSTESGYENTFSYLTEQVHLYS